MARKSTPRTRPPAPEPDTGSPLVPQLPKDEHEEELIDEALKQDTDALRDDLNALRSDIASLAATVKEMMVGKAREASSAAGENLDELRDRVEQMAEQVRDRGRAASEKLQRQVEERPLTSLLVAFAAGLVISRLLDRR